MKENQNQINHDVWSGCEYTNTINNIQYISDGFQVNPSTLWSKIGETSIHLTTTISNAQSMMLHRQNFNQNTILTATISILHTKGELLKLRINESSNIFTEVTIPVSSSPQEISVTRQILATGYVSINIVSVSDTEEAYLDNIRLTTS